MTTAVLLTEPKIQFFDNNGNPLAGGKVYTYTAGTTTPKASYTDSTAGTPNSNPVVLDSSGRADIWINGTYKIVVQDSLGNTISTTDNITSFTSASNATTFSDGTFALQNAADNTKQVTFSLSSVSTGTTTAVTIPNGSGTMITTAPGTSGNVLTSNGSAWISSAASAALGSNAPTTTYAPVAGDLGKLVDFTGSSNATFTLTSAVTLGSGWYCYIKNNGTSNAQLTLASSSGTIDGVSTAGYIMYAGEARIVQSDGTNFHTVLLAAGQAVFNSSTTWQRPPGYPQFYVENIAGGGSGASRTTTGNAGGGACGPWYAYTLPASSFVAVGSTETVTVGGTAAGVSGNTDGNIGNISSTTVNGTTVSTGSGATAATNAASGVAANGGVAGNTATYFQIADGRGTAAGSVTSGNVPSGGNGQVNAGSGGGASSSTAGGVRTGGTSLSGGAGGAGGANTGGNGTNGTAPGGGGGGAVNGGTSGSGAGGQVRITGVM